MFFRRGFLLQAIPRAVAGPVTVIPPATEITCPKVNQEDGYKLKLMFLDKKKVILNFHDQVHPFANAPVEDGEKKGPLFDREPKAKLMIAAPYVARLLGVLEGGLDSCQIVTNDTKGSFAPDGALFLLSCETVRKGEANLQWKVKFEPGAALLLHRFLVKALSKSQGF